MYNVFLAQKLRMSEFFINFFSSGPWPIQQPLEAAISTSATSTGHQILAEYVSFHIRYCLWFWHEIEVGLDYVLENVLPQPPN